MRAPEGTALGAFIMVVSDGGGRPKMRLDLILRLSFEGGELCGVIGKELEDDKLWFG